MRRSLIRLAFVAVCVFSLIGCGAVQVASGALNAVGAAFPDTFSGRGAKSVQVLIKGREDMNKAEDGKALSAIVRVFKLKEKNSFISAPYGTFGSADKEKNVLGDALAEAKELVLSPGQTLELKEKLDNDTPFLGVVTLFRSPSAQRWRMVFAADDIRRAGISLEVKDCQMTADGSAPISMTLKESAHPLSIQCK